MAEIGSNLAGINYWSTEEPFIDRIHASSPWLAQTASLTDITKTLPVNARGDITNLKNVEHLSVAVEMDPKGSSPSDEYVLTYDGKADRITVAGQTIVTDTPGRLVFDYKSTQPDPYANITFHGLDASDPISNVHVVRADQESLFKSGELFNPDFVQKVSEMGMVRMMGWADINDSAPITWDTRTTMDQASWSMQVAKGGVPIEVMVKLANEAHVDMWYNLPTKADDTYVKNALTYIRDHLDPSLKVHVEYSNEVWNSGFVANGYAQSQANALWGNGKSVADGANVYYGYRSAQIADIAHDVFGSQAASRLVDVVAGQAAVPGRFADILQGISKAGLGSASSLFDGYAIAPYFGAEMGDGVQQSDLQTVLGWAKSGKAGLDAAFHEIEYGGALHGDQSLAAVEKWIAGSAQVAHAAGLDLVAYEGGNSFNTQHWPTADKAAIQDLFNRMNADPRMGELYTKLIDNFKSVGGTDFALFEDIAQPTDSGSFGMLSSVYEKTSPRFAALLAERSGAGHGGGTGGSGNTGDTGHTGTTSPAGGTNDPGHTPTTTPAGGTGGTGGTGSTGGSGHTGSDGNAGGTDHGGSSTVGGANGGTSGGDHLIGKVGSETLDGAAGNDVITGGGSPTDKDTYIGGAGNDTITGGIGNDHIFGDQSSTGRRSDDGADNLSGGIGNDTIVGGGGADQLHGGVGNDSLAGGVGNDTIQGDGNNDTIVGGLGTDVLTGGSGNDLFVFRDHDADFTRAGLNWTFDEIQDFTHGQDRIDLGFHVAQVLDGSSNSALGAYLSATIMLNGHHGQADVAAMTVGTDTYLFYDADGSGGSSLSAIKLDKVSAHVVSTADFA